MTVYYKIYQSCGTSPLIVCRWCEDKKGWTEQNAQLERHAVIYMHHHIMRSLNAFKVLNYIVFQYTDYYCVDWQNYWWSKNHCEDR